MTGELAKVIIRGYNTDQEADQQGEPVSEFEAMFNPETFTITNAFQYDDEQSHGETGSEQKPKTAEPKELSFEFLVDGTSASGQKVEVQEQVDLFRETIGLKRVGGYTSKDQRSPLKLTISWGVFVVRCVLKKMEVKYTLFRPDGKPVRATIVASFSEYKTMELQAKENPEASGSSFSLSIPEAGKTFESVVQSNYGDAKSLIDIAKANGLNNIRALVPGGRLELPSTDELKQMAEDRARNFAQSGLDQLSDLEEDTVQSGLSQAESALPSGLSSLF